MDFRKVCVIIGAFCAMLLFAMCNNGGGSDSSFDSESRLEVLAVFFIPCNGVSASQIDKIADDFNKKFAGKQLPGVIVKILPHANLPKEYLNDNKTRFSAIKVMDYLTSKYLNEANRITDSIADREDITLSAYLIGVTDKDISTAIHNKPDYGILGLSYLRGGKCSIISTFRLKRKSDTWKLAAHEYCHGFFGCPHCPNDNPQCLMQDAKGGNPHFELKTVLCADCANKCTLN